MANPDEDFQGYMAASAESAAQRQADEEMYAAHERWRQTTWQGKIVTFIQAIGNHFKPFFLAVSDALQEENSKRALGHFVRFVMVVMGILALYAIANLIQTVIGKEIVIEQEVVIIEEVRQSDIDEENEKQDTSVTVEVKKKSKPRSSRDKKIQ